MADQDDRSDAYLDARGGALSWLRANWEPSLTVRDWWARLADSGWGFPAWPAAWFGQGLSADGAAGVRSAFPDTGALPPPASLGQMLGGPMLLLHASEEQQARFLPALARGEESWCQFFSEPEAGSDLASAQTKAVRDGGGWTVDGQKVWTSTAQWADRGMLLARTDRNVPKHAGLSFFVIDMDQPGIEVRPLHQMNGQHEFNEVFFTGARVDDDRVIGAPGDGWSTAVTVLMYERLMTSLPTAVPGRKAGQLDELAGAAAARAAQARAAAGASVSELVIDVATRLGAGADPVLRQRLAELWALETATGYLTRGGLTREGARPSAHGSLAKLARSRLARSGRETGMAVLGAQGLLQDPEVPGGSLIRHRALTSPGTSIAGGTDEVQRGIVGERVLGLPREPRADRDLPFSELTTGTRRTGD
jgi:alkylation response protein AidB-like acyl-CoA dehydrogenase